MAIVGNQDGPKESEIVGRLGPDYFALDYDTWLAEIDWYRDSERTGQVVPVYVDDGGSPYLLFSSRSSKTTKRCYLEELGYKLTGIILVRSMREAISWTKRWRKHHLSIAKATDGPLLAEIEPDPLTGRMR